MTAGSTRRGRRAIKLSFKKTLREATVSCSTASALASPELKVHLLYLLTLLTYLISSTTPAVLTHLLTYLITSLVVPETRNSACNVAMAKAHGGEHGTVTSIRGRGEWSASSFCHLLYPLYPRVARIIFSFFRIYIYLFILSLLVFFSPRQLR